jgi:hypothetical protein
MRDIAELLAREADERVGVGVGTLLERCEDRHARPRHTQIRGAQHALMLNLDVGRHHGQYGEFS